MGSFFFIYYFLGFSKLKIKENNFSSFSSFLDFFPKFI
jgi:hypothetical protein